MHSHYPTPITPRIYTQESRARRRIRRNPADFAALFAGVLLLAFVTLGLGWQVWHQSRIYTGVNVSGVPIGGITRSAALARLEEAFLRHSLPPMSVEYDGRQWPITADHVRVQTDLLGAVNQAYLVGRQGTLPERFATQLAALLGGVNLTPSYAIDNSQLRQVVNQIASDVRRAPRPEARIGDTVIAAEPGLDVDVEMTVQSLAAGLRDVQPGSAIRAPLHVVSLTPLMQSDTQGDTQGETIAVNPAVEPVSAMTLSPLRLRDTSFGLEFAIDPATLRTLLISEDPLVVDEEKVRNLLIQWSEQINISPRDARLRWDRATSSPVILQTSRPGRQLDVEGTASAIQVALSTGNSFAPLNIRSVPPAVDSNRIAEMGIRELVGSGTTHFGGSSAARVRNIEISAEKFDGVVIPPNGIFSFNHFVEDVSAANGFEDSLIIWGDRTAVGIGGGICQVSTTIFRAAFLTGMPIVERYNHGYIVDWYGEPGLDATIYTPTVDFRFRNDTAGYLLIEPVVNAGEGTMTFNLYGTKPDRTVTIGSPTITDVQPAPPPLYTVDSSLAPGDRRQVEWQKQGMTVRIERTITENGVSRTEPLISKYQPWRAIYLVGSGSDVPETTSEATALLSND